MKIMYVNDSCYNFVDEKGVNQAQLLVKGRSLNFLDVRKFQLASMIKGKWCTSNSDVDLYFYIMQSKLSAEELGLLVKEFELFNSSSKNFIATFSKEAIKIISSISSETNIFDFLVEKVEKDAFLSTPLKDVFTFYKSLNYAGFTYVYEIVNLNENELKKIRNIGEQKCIAVKRALAAHGLSLKS